MSDERVWQRLTFQSGTRQRKSAAGVIPSAPAAETPLESAEVESLGRQSPSADSSGAKGLTAQSPLEGTAPLVEPEAVLPLPAASGLHSVHHRHHPQ